MTILLLTYDAGTVESVPKRQLNKDENSKLVPDTIILVPPVIGPVDGTRLVTVAPSTYSNIMFSEEYSSPLFVTATFIEPVTKTTGDAQSIHSVVLHLANTYKVSVSFEKRHFKLDESTKL